MKQTTHRVIYSHYETWAIHKAYVFKRFHKYKCRDIDIEDLTSYSLSGLQKAVQNYNGKSFFHKYAEIYISGELYKGLTDLQPLNNIPTALKKKKQCLLKTQHNYIYKKRLNTLFVGYDEYWQFEKRQPEIDDERKYDWNTYYEIWNHVNELEPFSKKVFQAKYDFELSKIRSNKKISEILGCSEEHVRTTLIQSTKNIFHKHMALKT